MPKLKTNKAMKKRFRITKNRKVLSTKGKRRHLLTDRSSKMKRKLRGYRLVDNADKKGILKGLPYDR